MQPRGFRGAPRLLQDLHPAGHHRKRNRASSLAQVAERHAALAPPGQRGVTQAADGDVLVSEQSLTLPFPRHHRAHGSEASAGLHPTLRRRRGGPAATGGAAVVLFGGGGAPNLHEEGGGAMESTHRSAGARELWLIFMQPIHVADVPEGRCGKARRGSFQKPPRTGISVRGDARGSAASAPAAEAEDAPAAPNFSSAKAASAPRVPALALGSVTVVTDPNKQIRGVLVGLSGGKHFTCVHHAVDI